jgi:hypothetical protein
MIQEGQAQFLSPGRRRQPAARGVLGHVGDLAVDVELYLQGGCIACAHGPGACIAREPIELPFRQVALARHTVHDLQLIGTARHGAQQPVLPVIGFFGVARVQQGQQRERGVAQPAEAIVPVAHAAQAFRQRGRRRGNDAAGGVEAQPLERDKRSAYVA